MNWFQFIINQFMHAFSVRKSVKGYMYNSRFARPDRGGSRNFGGQRRRPGLSIDVQRFINKVDTVFLDEVYEPNHRFSDFKFEERLAQNIEAKGYDIPTPIQDQSIKHTMSGTDVLGIANTGTGKTAAFLLPLINKILINRSEKILILAPTRELATQIDEEFRSFVRGCGLYSVVCIGGASMNVQISQLRRSYNVVVATPGRLKDLVQHRALSLSQFKNVVVDEVDQMFDMGFVKDIQLILEQLPSERQSLFFSATLSPEINKLVKAYLRNPVTVALKTRDTAATVDQDIVRITNAAAKIEVLHDLLNTEECSKVLIFGRTKRGVHKLCETLVTRGFRADSIHGDKTQYARQQALNKFKQNRVEILVATDVAARGIDIPDVSHVINYELPESYDDYVHRIGRTGRANRLGKALTFVE